jgi:hypothetical protein
MSTFQPIAPMMSTTTTTTPRQKITVPRVEYNLMEVLDPQQVFNHIEKIFTNITSHVAIEAKNKFTAILNARAHTHSKKTVFSCIRGPANTDVTRRVIGKDGYFFKMTTTLCGIDFLWFDKETNYILCWGPNKFSVVKALNSIRWRICKQEIAVSEQTQKRQQQQPAALILDPDCDYSDMPALISIDEEEEEEDEDEQRQISMGRTPDYERTSIE